MEWACSWGRQIWPRRRRRSWRAAATGRSARWRVTSPWPVSTRPPRRWPTSWSTSSCRTMALKKEKAPATSSKPSKSGRGKQITPTWILAGRRPPRLSWFSMVVQKWRGLAERATNLINQKSHLTYAGDEDAYLLVEGATSQF